MLILLCKGDHILPIFKLGLGLPIYWRWYLNQQGIASERSSEKWKASVLNASSYTTALEKVKRPDKFPTERLVRCDALNGRLTSASHAHSERNTPRVLAAQKRFALGVCVGDNKAAMCKVWVRERPWHCPVLRPEEEQALGRALCWKGPFCRLCLENNQLLSAKNLPHISHGG